MNMYKVLSKEKSKCLKNKDVLALKHSARASSYLTKRLTTEALEQGQSFQEKCRLRCTATFQSHKLLASKAYKGEGRLATIETTYLNDARRWRNTVEHY